MMAAAQTGGANKYLCVLQNIGRSLEKRSQEVSASGQIISETKL